MATKKAAKAAPTVSEGLIAVSDLKEYLLKDGVDNVESYMEIAGIRYVKIANLASWTKKDAEAPKETPAPATVPAPELKEVTLKPTEAKRIPKYSRYEVTSDGIFRNATTGTEIAKEQKGEHLKVRLTSDTGSRDWVETEKIFNDLFQPTVIEGKPKKESAKPAIPTTLSKSQQIWLASADDKKTIKEILELIPGSVESHVRNVIKDYTKNPEKAAKAAKVRDLVVAEAK